MLASRQKAVKVISAWGIVFTRTPNTPPMGYCRRRRGSCPGQWPGAFLQLVEHPGGVEGVSEAQLRGLLQRLGNVRALGVAYFLVPGIQVGMGPFLAQDV